MIGLEALAVLVRTARLPLHDEKACQAALAAWLRQAAPPETVIERERRLGPRDIVDFLIDGRIVIEVKMNQAQPRAVVRQLERYAAHEGVEALLLATNRRVLLPAVLAGKPVAQVSLGEAWL